MNTKYMVAGNAQTDTPVGKVAGFNGPFDTEEQAHAWAGGRWYVYTVLPLLPVSDER